jgi:hypothetical protein
MPKRAANTQLTALLHQPPGAQALASAVNIAGAENGVVLRYDRTSVAHWLSGSRPSPAGDRPGSRGAVAAPETRGGPRRDWSRSDKVRPVRPRMTPLTWCDWAMPGRPNATHDPRWRPSASPRRSPKPVSAGPLVNDDGDVLGVLTTAINGGGGVANPVNVARNATTRDRAQQLTVHRIGYE